MSDKIVSLKLCKNCGESKLPDEFYKWRNVCKACRIKYDKNRREDLKDGKRDSLNWYRSNQDMMIPRDIEHIEEERRDTSVSQVRERELRNEDEDNSSRSIFIFTMLPVVLIIYVILNDLGFV